MYLRFPCYCDACLNSSDLRVGLKTLLNTTMMANVVHCIPAHELMFVLTTLHQNRLPWMLLFRKEQII